MSTVRPLQQIFEAIPQRYDLINHLFTFGFDSRWRDKAAKLCLSEKPLRFLDLGCGTGDLSIAVARLSDEKLFQIGLDYSKPMLDIALTKARDYSKNRIVDFVEGNAADLPFRDGAFDSVGIAFAFRNLTYRNKYARAHFSEIFRVLSKSGKYVIVESSQPNSKIVRALDHFYLKVFVFWLGYLISGNGGAYRYLVQSAANFYHNGEIKNMLHEAGFKEVKQFPQLFGAACIHVALK